MSALASVSIVGFAGCTSLGYSLGPTLAAMGAGLSNFTDTGLKEQLAERLQPIVARAGAELVTAINEHVGKLVRAYVAEAIEREIAQWRKDH